MELSGVAINGVIIVSLISAIIEMLKKVGLKEKFCPLVATVIGAILGVFYVVPTDILSGLLVGISLGLSSCGLYDTYSQLKK